MKDNIYIFEVRLDVAGTGQEYKKLHFLAWNLFQATHLVMEYIYDEDSEFESDVPLEIGSIHKVPGINGICNEFFALDMMESEGHNHDEYDPNMPFEMLNNVGKNDEQIMSFKHSCGQDVRCVNFQWPYIVCPNPKCQKKIFHKDIEEVGGIFLFTGLDDNKK